MTRRWRAATRVVHTKTSRGGLLLDPASKAYFELNETGLALWRALGSGASESELVEMLRETFDVAPEQADRDVAAWLEALRASALIETADAADAG